MSLEEKIALCSGEDLYSTKAFEKYGIPSIWMTDGPHGIRKAVGGGNFPGSNHSVPATCFPTASATACSWDRGLLREMGEALAEEALQEGVSVILGPGVNIKRNPLCGRNFEYFSEDPFLAGELAENWIRGVQSRGIGVSLKHFAGNNQENLRASSDSLIDERTLREIYLPAFEKAVKEAKPTSVMCAYNKLNGVYCSDHEYLLRHILRHEWGFEGVVVSDWGAVNDRIQAFKAGLDLEMPSSQGFFDQAVIQAVRNGTLAEERVNESVDRLLSLILAAQENRKEGFQYNIAAHHRLAQRLAGSSAVLLKNQDHLLPIQKDQARVALIGALAKEPRYQGAGSSFMIPTQLSSAVDGFQTQGVDYVYYPGYMIQGGDNEKLLQEAVDGATKSTVAVVFAGLTETYESEGFDRTDMRLPSDQNELISQVAAANPNTVVVLAGGAPVEMPWLAQVKAVLQMYLPGQAGGQAAAELLTGAVNPSGKLAESFPFSYLDVPSAGLFEKGGKQAQYREGIYVGYRYYDKANQAVCFPFGYGLSYTTFTYSHLQLSRKEMQAADELLATVRVKNSGDRDGAEIVQLYVSDLEPAISRPAKELKGFEKVFLKAGEEIEVIFPLNVRSFAWYDAAGGAWVVPEGRYQISIGASSRDIRLQEEVILHGSRPKIDDARQCRWYTSLEGKPTEDDFQALMGHPIVPPKKVRKGEFDLSSSVLDMKGSLFIRAMLRWIERTVAAEFGGADYRNPNFRMVMEFTTTSPVKNLVIASSGRFPITVAQGLIELANGHYLKGMKYFLSKKA